MKSFIPWPSPSLPVPCSEAEGNHLEGGAKRVCLFALNLDDSKQSFKKFNPSTLLCDITQESDHGHVKGPSLWWLWRWNIFKNGSSLESLQEELTTIDFSFQKLETIINHLGLPGKAATRSAHRSQPSGDGKGFFSSTPPNEIIIYNRSR